MGCLQRSFEQLNIFRVVSHYSKKQYLASLLGSPFPFYAKDENKIILKKSISFCKATGMSVAEINAGDDSATESQARQSRGHPHSDNPASWVVSVVFSRSERTLTGIRSIDQISASRNFFRREQYIL